MRNDYDAGDREFEDEDYGSDGLRWMSVVVVLLVVLGFFSLAWYAYHTGGQTETAADGVPVVQADAGLMKEKPADPGGMNIPNRDKTIYGAMEKNGSGQAPVEHLTEAPEEPVVGRGGEPVAPQAAPAAVEGSTTTVYRKEDAVSGEAVESGTEDTNEAIAAQVNQYEQEMANTKNPAAAVENKLQTELTPRVSSTAEVVASAMLNPEADVAPAPKQEPAPAPVATVQESAPVVDTAAQAAEAAAIALKAQQDAAKAKAKAEADAKAKAEKLKAEKAKAADAVKVATGSAQIQVAAARSREDAESAWKRISGKNAALKGLGHTIVTVDVPGKGTFYRLRATGLSAASAASVCAQLKSSGQDCMVVK